MTSFNVESEFLDLKKTYQAFEYEHLTTAEVVRDPNISHEVYEGMTQNTYLFVQEKEVLLSDIQNLSTYFRFKHCKKEVAVNAEAFKEFPFDKVKDRVCFIFQKYQEQPTLLDTLLEGLTQPIMEVIRDFLYLQMKNSTDFPPNHQLDCLLMIIYQLTKVRGVKWVIQYFPHEVRDLYPALGYMAGDNSGQWESKYVILLWLGVIVLVPFDLDIIDSGFIQFPKEDKSGNASEIVELMLQIAKHYLKALTKVREAAAEFIGKLFTRPDIQKRKVLTQYIDYIILKLRQIKDNPLGSFFVCGLYESLIAIFKLVQRNELLPLIPRILEQLQFEKGQIKDTSTKKELKMKLLTRIGITYLKPRNITWAFKRKKQSLLTNLQKNIDTTRIKTNVGTNLAPSFQPKNGKIVETLTDDNEYYRDVNKEQLQEIIDMLVEGLNAKETTAREDASKGLGMIAGRLSQDMVDDIIDYILNLNPSPQTQHSICLTIAQLIRRNLISPTKLSEMYQLMRDSLLYEQEEGGYSVGQAVRDAACYMTWSVARGYEQGGKQLGISLMITACFDREVGCRRAASAAYQELVGRVGDVPNGIEILTEADYFTLGLQKNAYLNVAIFVASYEPYFKPFVEHLCYQKLKHWDLQIKRIAACSLSRMSCLHPQFYAKEILPSLVKLLEGSSMNSKLGIIIGLGEILIGMKGLSHLHQLHNQMKDSVFLKSLTQNQKKLIKAGEYMEAFKTEYAAKQHIDNFEMIGKETLRAVVDWLTRNIKDSKIYKGKVGQNFRIYTCRLLECFAFCQLGLQDAEINCFLQFMEQSLKNPLEPILNAVTKSLKPFISYYSSKSKSANIFINTVIAGCKGNLAISKCYTLALSKLDAQNYLQNYTSISQVLEKNCKISKENNDPEKRKYAIIALEAMVKQIGYGSSKLSTEQVQHAFQILFHTVQDYTVDKRGDIGSIVRQQSMTSMLAILRYFCDNKWQIAISSGTVTKVIAAFLQQLSQKIDRIRLLAGSLLQSYFDQLSEYFQVEHKKELGQVFCQSNVKAMMKENQSKLDKDLELDVIKMEMKIQENIFHEAQRYLVYSWNVPHHCFPVVVPLLRLPAYRYSILKGFCTSSGGISESVIKHSLAELGNYITSLFKQPEDLRDQNLQALFTDALAILKAQFRQERVVVAMYKTLDFILERQEVITWPGLRKFDTELFYSIEKETLKTKSISKVSASTGLYVSLLQLNNEETKRNILQSIIKILTSDLPTARKILADKLLMYVMSCENELIFSEDQKEKLTQILSENDFVEQKLNVDAISQEIKKLLNIK